ncbi:DDE-type integrase/transposase/recombinase [Paraclostridium ghonii]|nr:DDE-type integrase/transposase/recombinase [Paeniclostridium ghonii]
MGWRYYILKYIPTNEGFLYFISYMDMYSCKIVGWSMDKRMREDLVIDALELAIGRENPKQGLIMNTDRRFQFIGKRY